MNDGSKVDIYSRLGFSSAIGNYAHTLPRLENWSVRMHENGLKAKVELFYSIGERSNALSFEMPTMLALPRNPVSSFGCIENSGQPLQELLYKKFMKYKPCVDPCVAFFAGSALCFRQDVVPSLYITLFVMAIVSVYFCPSIFRGAFRLFNSHPFNQINELYKLLIESKDEAVMQKIAELLQDNKYVALRSRFVGFSPYDKNFQLKYAFVNGYIAYKLKEYDNAEQYFARALSLGKSSSEQFCVLKAYVDMLSESRRPLGNTLENLCNEIKREHVFEKNYVIVKDKLHAVLQSLCVHDEEKSIALLDKVYWSKFYDILYPNLAVTYYGLKQLFCFMMKSTQGDSNLDVETYFRRGVHYRGLAEEFTRKCGVDSQQETSAIARYH